MIILLVMILTVIVVCSTLFYRYRVSALLERIRERLNAAVSGDYTVVPYNNGFESAIGEEVNRLLGILQEQNEKHGHEQQVITQFLSDVSHQIKTPLSNIMIYSELVESGQELTKENRELLGLVVQQSEKVDFLVSMLIKASRMELEMIKIHAVPQSLDELISRCCKEKNHEAEHKDIRFSVKSCDVICPIDVNWMQEALGNILDNAVKYSPNSSTVHISVSKYGLFWCIHIKDSGCGIQEEEQGLIFQRFYRAKNSHNKQGLGIGLYLAREIVRQHVGYIEVQSEKGKGSEFRVFLPQN